MKGRSESSGSLSSPSSSWSSIPFPCPFEEGDPTSSSSGTDGGTVNPGSTSLPLLELDNPFSPTLTTLILRPARVLPLFLYSLSLALTHSIRIAVF